MPSVIRVLDEKTINKIAAGEVIENSASCVKELIENALDAKANSIEIHIIAGGRKKIEVIDNGAGMSPDDALLALERHATSKLKKIEDMNTLVSMGFRGEALPSISSISKMNITTSDGTQATEIKVSGGQLLKHEVTSRPKGTTIEVCSLFFNVPARGEFQKSVSYDIQEVTKVITHQALAHPHIGFRFVSDQKEVFNLIGQSSLNFLDTTRYRIQELYGEELATSLIAIDEKIEDLEVKGFISDTQTTRPNRLGQHFYINGRCVQSKLISWSLQEGYSTRLPQRRFPLAFLFIEIAPHLVDVNVHPQKREVRFKDPFILKQELSKMVDRALQMKPYMPVQEEQRVLVEEPHKEEQLFEFKETPQFSSSSVYDQVHKIKILEKEPVFSKQELSLELTPFITGIFDVYLFVEAKSCQSALNLPQKHLDGILMIHQKRAKERILFEHLMRVDQQVAIQSLLLPETLDFSPTDALIITNCLSLFNQLGISIRSLKGNTFIIDGLPAILQTTDAKNIMEEVLVDIRSFGFHGVLSAEKGKILAKAISKSVNFEKKIKDLHEAQALVQKLLKSEDPLTSPKGKTIIKVLDQNDLSKLLN